MLIGMNLFAQPNSIDIIEKFIDDVKDNQVSDLDLIKKHFVFQKIETDSDIENIVSPILTPKLAFIRQKLNKDCSELIIMKHDEYSDMIKSFKLKSENFANVYYIICDSTIIAPILVKGSKILSISAYSKSEGGTKSFVLF